MTPFPWRAGMRAIDAQGRPWRLYVGADGLLCAQGEPEGYAARWAGSPESVGARPDPNDGATKGALLDAVREAFNAPAAQVTPYTRWDPVAQRTVIDEWMVCLNDAEDRSFRGHASEFAALLAAREAAP